MEKAYFSTPVESDFRPRQATFPSAPPYLLLTDWDAVRPIWHKGLRR